RLVTTSGIDGDAERLALSADGRHLAIPTPAGGGVVHLGDGSKESFKGEAPVGVGGLSGGGGRLALGGANHVRVLEVATGQEVARLKYRGNASKVILGQEGWYLLTKEFPVRNEGTRGEYSDSVVRLHEIRTGRNLASHVREGSGGSTQPPRLDVTL